LIGVVTLCQRFQAHRNKIFNFFFHNIELQYIDNKNLFKNGFFFKWLALATQKFTHFSTIVFHLSALATAAIYFSQPFNRNLFEHYEQTLYFSRVVMGKKFFLFAKENEKSEKL
jgi:hypothetical protein